MDDSLRSEDHPPAGPETPRKPGRLWLALATGLALAVPASWALAALAMLPRLLGLFFFLLAGLLIGAVMYRVGLPAAPAPRPRLYCTGLAVALTLWMGALVVEYRSLPELAFGAVRGQIQFRLSPERRQHIREALHQHVEADLKTHYPPGGLIGYMRWVTGSGAMSVPRVIDNTSVHFQLSQRGGWWLVRAGLSLAFLAGAILSQILTLGPPQPAEVNNENAKAS